MNASHRLRDASKVYAAVTICCLVVVAILGSTSAAAAPVGLIEQFKIDGTPLDLLPGPGGEIWFTYLEVTRQSESAGIGRITERGKITKFTTGLNPHGLPEDLALGLEGNLWFTDAGKRPAIGRITPRGKIAEFGVPIDPRSHLRPPVAGPDGNIWFGISGRGAAIVRITPQGSLTEFSAGLSPDTWLGPLVLGADGNLWFGDKLAGRSPAIGQITPTGQITEFGGLPWAVAGSLYYPPVLGADGNLWISGVGPSPSIARITPLGAVTFFSAGLSPQSYGLGPLVAAPDGNVWFAATGSADPKTPTPGPVTAIGRITPDGAISEFSECLHPGPPQTGPNSLAVGPEGDVWYTSITTEYLNIGSPPAIGRVTPSGEITEFRQGLSREDEPDQIVAGADGSMWFANNATGSIGRVRPSAAPANTFIVHPPRPVSAGRAAMLPVTVPGPGRIALQPLAIVSIDRRPTHLPRTRPLTATATGCGATILAIKPRGLAKTSFDRVGEVRLKTRITFTPTGGSPYSRTVTIPLERRGRG